MSRKKNTVVRPRNADVPAEVPETACSEPVALMDAADSLETVGQSTESPGSDAERAETSMQATTAAEVQGCGQNGAESNDAEEAVQTDAPLDTADEVAQPKGSNCDPQDTLLQEMMEAEAHERAQFGTADGGAASSVPADHTAPRDSSKQAAASAAPEQVSHLPSISAALPLRDQTRLVLDAVASVPVETLAQYNGRLCRIRRGHKRGARIEAHNKASLRGVVARSCRIISARKDDVREVIPSDPLLEDIMSLPDYPATVKHITRIAQTPLILNDNRLLSEPGLDESSGVYLWTEPRLRDLRMPEVPSPQDVSDALEVLADITADMPFVDAASYANYIAFLLTPLLEERIGGCKPILVIDAPQQGSGKGLLTAIISIVATGSEPASQTTTSSDEEMHKMLTSCLRRGAPIIALDNVVHILDQASLASFTTSPVVQARILGHTRIEEFTNTACVIANGNNVRVGGDMARRVVWCRVDPACSTPWMRSGFKHDPLIPYVKEQRPRIIRALLTIARHGLAEGECPGQIPVLGSFESWSRTIGTILAKAGVEGFLENRHSIYESADEEASEMTAFFRQWLAVIGSEPVAARDVIARLDPDDLPSSVTAGQAGRGSIVKRLAKLLSRTEKRRFGDENVHVVSISGSSNTLRWRVISDTTNS